MQGNADNSLCSPSQLPHSSPDPSPWKPNNKMADNRESTHIRSRSQEISVRSFPDDRAINQGEGRARDHRVGERDILCGVRERSIERRPRNTCDTYDEVEEVE